MPKHKQQVCLLAIWITGLLMMMGNVLKVFAQGPSSQIEFVSQMDGNVRDIAVSGNYAYINMDTRLGVVDISRPAYPVLIGQTETLSGNVSRFQVIENTPFIAVLASDMHIVDVSDPAQPKNIGFFDTSSSNQDITTAGNYVYIADWYGGLRIIDISDPTNPDEIGFYQVTAVEGVAVADDYAYVPKLYHPRIDIVNVSVPTTPTQVSTYDVSTKIFDIAIQENHAYVAAAGLHILDISNPVALSEISTHYESGSLYGLEVVNDYAYLALSPVLDLSTGTFSGGGVGVVNISDPADPKHVDFFDTVGQTASKVAVQGNYVYTADTDGGLVTLWFAQPVTTSISTANEESLTSPADQTTYTFPTGIFTDTVVMTHTARFPSKAPSPGTLVDIDHVFDVTAVYSSTGQSAQLVAGQSYTITIQYTEAEQGPAIEETLALYYWDGNQWIREGSSIVDTTNNTVTATPDHWVELWAVLAETQRTYMPIVLK